MIRDDQPALPVRAHLEVAVWVLPERPLARGAVEVVVAVPALGDGLRDSEPRTRGIERQGMADHAYRARLHAGPLGDVVQHRYQPVDVLEPRPQQVVRAV